MNKKIIFFQKKKCKNIFIKFSLKLGTILCRKNYSNIILIFIKHLKKRSAKKDPLFEKNINKQTNNLINDTTQTQKRIYQWTQVFLKPISTHSMSVTL